jgi:hypothetical protein
MPNLADGHSATVLKGGWAGSPQQDPSRSGGYGYGELLYRLSLLGHTARHRAEF